jgi:Coenzyme PQQ synthesis protein D (PqqD)
MFDLHTRLQPNENEVAAKIIDGEAILINLSTGVYYSMTDVGAVMWELIGKRSSLGEIIQTITEIYDVPADQARADTERLAAQLLEEALVFISEGRAATGTDQRPVSSPRVPYQPPQLRIYRDMNELLALDPPMPRIDDVPWKSPASGT